MLVVEVAPLLWAYVKTSCPRVQTSLGRITPRQSADEGWQETGQRCVIALAF